MTTKQKANLTLDPDTIGILARVGNRSEYVNSLIRDASQRWQTALVHLVPRYPRRFLLAACDAYNGHLRTYHDNAMGFRIGMTDAEEYESLSKKWKVAEYNECVKRISESDMRAFFDIIDEFWAGNDGLRRELEKSDPKPTKS